MAIRVGGAGVARAQAMMLLVMMLVGCVAEDARYQDCPRIPWSGVDSMVAAAHGLAPGDMGSDPMHLEVVLPNDMATQDRERVHQAFASRRYHAELFVIGMFGYPGAFMVQSYLADPVGFSDVRASRVGATLWAAGIPFSMTLDNSNALILPRRAVPVARAVLKDLVGQGGWERCWDATDR